MSTWGLQQQLDMLCEAAHARGGPRGPASLMMKCGCATRWRVLAPACTAQCKLPPAAACGGADKERTCHLVRQAVLQLQLQSKLQLSSACGEAELL